MKRSLCQRRAAGGHGQNFCANRASATDVKWRAANDEDFFAAQILLERAAGALPGGHGDLIAVFVVVGERAGFKQIPQTEVAELDFRAESDVAGEQSEHGRLGERLQGADKFTDAGAGCGLVARQNMIEPENILLEEAAKVFRRGGDVMNSEKLPDDAHIRASRELEFFNAIVGLAFLAERLSQRLHARAAGAN